MQNNEKVNERYLGILMMIIKNIDIAKKSLLITLLIFTFAYTQIFSQSKIETEKILEKMCNEIIKSTSFRFISESSGREYFLTSEIPSGEQVKIKSPYNDWRYWNGVLGISFIKLSSKLNMPELKNYVAKNFAFSFDNVEYFRESHKEEWKWSYPYGQLFITEELDDCGAMGASLIELFKFDNQPRYRNYINASANHILKKQIRLKDNTLVRHFPAEYTIWADDLYMGLVFLSRMGEFTGEQKYFDDAALQVINYHKYLFNEQKGLMHHCWYSDLKRNGVAFWGRANGWAMLAQIELLERLPKNHPKRKILISLLQKHILGIAQYQSGNGLWRQLLDKPDSYNETSCSAMFTYAIASAVKNGFIEERYLSIAIRGWEGIMTKIDKKTGEVVGVCAGTVVSDDLVYYYNRPTPLNDIHGLGAIILAGIEMLDVLK